MTEVGRPGCCAIALASFDFVAAACFASSSAASLYFINNSSEREIASFHFDVSSSLGEVRLCRLHALVVLVSSFPIFVDSKIAMVILQLFFPLDLEVAVVSFCNVVKMSKVRSAEGSVASITSSVSDFATDAIVSSLMVGMIAAVDFSMRMMSLLSDEDRLVDVVVAVTPMR